MENKNTKKNPKIIIIIAAIIWLVLVLAICLRLGFSGAYLNADSLSYRIDVNGENMQLTIRSTNNSDLQYVDFDESEGVIKVSVRSIPNSLFYNKTKEISFSASQSIQQVWIGDRIIWADNETFSPLTSKLYSVYNPYIGDMSANGDIVRALNMTAFTGNFSNELQTSEEPYSWKIKMQNDFSSSLEAAFEDRLSKYAYILLAEIGNLNEVIYEYSIDGTPKTLSVTAEAATIYAGTDIKEVGTSLHLLEQLVRKTELSNILANDVYGLSGDANTGYFIGKNML